MRAVTRTMARMRALPLLTAICAVLLCPTAVSAQSTADGQLWSLNKLAQSWWEKRIPEKPCPTVTPSIDHSPEFLIGEPEDEIGLRVSAKWLEGYARYNSCAWSLTAHYASFTRTTRFPADELIDECVTGLHEYGHGVYGLSHKDEGQFPIMREGTRLKWSEVPKKCVAWARGIIRVRRTNR